MWPPCCEIYNSTQTRQGLGVLGTLSREEVLQLDALKDLGQRMVMSVMRITILLVSRYTGY